MDGMGALGSMLGGMMGGMGGMNNMNPNIIDSQAHEIEEPKPEEGEVNVVLTVKNKVKYYDGVYSGDLSKFDPVEVLGEDYDKNYVRTGEYEYTHKDVYEDNKDLFEIYDEEEIAANKKKAITIRTATPFIINTAESNGKFVATLTFLCVMEDDSIITISTNHLITTVEDKDLMALVDFHADNEFINNKICYNYIAKYLPSYYSEFKFNVENFKDNVITLPSIRINNRSSITFYMNPEVYTCMSFINDYVSKCDVENNYDLRLATVAGSKVNSDVEFFVVDNIDSIVSMVSTSKKPKGLDAIKSIFTKDENTNIGLVFRASRIVNGEKEVVSILTPFDVGVMLDKDKFKGDTIESLQETYYGDADQFVGTLLIDDCHIYGIDKSYMIIRGKNKTGSTKIFLLDTNITTDLVHKVKDY